MSFNARPKIVIFSHSAKLGGAERSLLTLIAASNDLGIDLVVILPELGPLADLIRAASPSTTLETLRLRWWFGASNPYRQGLSFIVRLPSELRRCRSLLRTHGASLAFVNSSVLLSPLIAARTLRLPSIVMVRESILSNTRMGGIFPRGWIRGLLTRVPTRIIAVSHYVSSQLGESSKITVIHPDVHATDSTDERRVISEPLRLVGIGSIHREKGTADLVEAVALLHGWGHKVRLVLVGAVGDADYAQNIFDRISELRLSDYIQILEEVTNVKQVYKTADICLVASPSEAYGRVTAESICSGVPVVAYDAGGSREILGPGGGLLVESTPWGLAEAVAGLLENRDSFRKLLVEVAERTTHGEIGGHAADVWNLVTSTLPNSKSISRLRQ